MNKKNIKLLAEANNVPANQPEFIDRSLVNIEIDDLANAQMSALRITTDLLLADYAGEISLSAVDKKQLILVYRELKDIMYE